MHHTRFVIVQFTCLKSPSDWEIYGVVVSFKIACDFRYSANYLEIYSPPPSVRNRFTCLPDFYSLRAFHSLNFSRASDLYFNVYSFICLVVWLMKSSIYRPPPMAVSRGLYMSKCTTCIGSVAREVVEVMGFRATSHMMQLSQSHFPVISRALGIVGKVSRALRLACARRRCHNIRFSASCRDSCPVVCSASRQLSLISVYSVDTGVQSRTNRPST
jgi:hypothetical protein